MALRKFSKYMKLMTILIIVSVVLSASYAGYSYLTAYLHNKKQVLFKLDGEKVYKEDFENEYRGLVSNIDKLYGQVGANDNKEFNKIPDKVIKEMALASVVNRTMTKVLAHNMKIEVSSVDINQKVTEIENQYGGKQTLSLMLAQKGATIKDLRDNIKESLIYQKMIDKLKEKYRPKEEDLEKIYKRFQYTEFSSKKYEEVKEQVETLYYNQTMDFVLKSNVEVLFEKSNITTKDKEIKSLFENLKKKEVEVGDIKVIRKEMLSFYASEAIQNPKGYYDGIENKVNENKVKELQMLLAKEKKANEAGIKGFDGLTPINRVQSAIQNYYYYLVDNYNPNEADMMKWFVANKAKYDTKNTISGEIFGIKYKASEADLKETENRANELIKKLNKDNFSKFAKELSEDPSTKENGGSLGWINLNQLVKEFSAVADARAGSIIGPVKTVYGYHIIYVQEKDKNDLSKAKISHILLTPKISEKTKEDLKKEVLNIASDIKASKLTFEQITKDKTGKYNKFDIREQYTLLEKNSALPKVGYSKELMEELFSKSVGEILQKDLGDSFVIIQKTQEIPYKSAEFKDFKDRVRTEMAFDYANKVLSE